MATCSTCSGRGFVFRRVPQMAHGTIYETDQGHLAWPAQGGKPVRVEYPTGRETTLSFVCEDCQGSGRVPDPTPNVVEALYLGLEVS